MIFKDKYTLQTSIDAEMGLKPEEKKESNKIVLSNDAYALGESLEQVKIMLWRLKNG